MRLLVGLGNPGTQYVGTRHNVGFAALDILAARGGIALNRRRFGGWFGRGLLADVAVLLLKPLTFMNLSGPAVGRALDYHGLGPSDLLVLHDDMDLTAGRIKVTFGGGPAGHKGVASIIEALAARDFARVRLGVGRPSERRDAVDHVLGRFDAAEEGLLREAMVKAADATLLWLSRGLTAAQNRYNRPEPPDLDPDPGAGGTNSRA
ncbi:MAG: aminoacyl-tRNA hydrolase [Thermodesulfobacteriota bacterium]